MPKEVLQITNFSGGLDAYSDPRDIEDNEFCQNWGAAVSKSGIIRASGMADSYISTDHFQSRPLNFQEGYGLFQFSSDYSLSGIDGSFSSGITTGIIATYTNTTTFTLEDKYNTSSENDYYNDFIIFIYSGTGKGESRKITDYVGSSRTVTCVAFSGALHNKDDNIPSKYIIYRWTPSSNFLGDGSNNYDYVNEYSDGQYSLLTKSGNVTSTQSKNLGYVAYEPLLSLIPGAKYTVSFDCKTLARYYNDVSNGSEDGSGTTYGDKVPWVQIYSTTVADTRGSIKALSDSTPTSFSSYDTSSGAPNASWEQNQTHTFVYPDSTSGQGEDVAFNIFTDANGNPRFYMIPSLLGKRFKAGDTLSFSDPGSTSNTATITVGSINITGLSLMSSGGEDLSYYWVKGIKGDGNTSNYITNVDSNYIDNGDFTAGATDQWALVNHDDGSAHGLTAARADANHSYNGITNTSLKLTSSLNHLNDGDESGWISQTVTLDELTPYSLNFVYSVVSPYGNAEIRILGPDDEPLYNEILPATIHAGDEGADVAPVYKFANAKISGEWSNDFSSIQFTTPLSKTSAATTSCKIQFRPRAGNVSKNEFFLHGVVLYKNHFDLSNTSYGNPESNNPFNSNVTEFSTYSFSFIVPENYTSVSDWVFRVYAGHYGWVSLNTLSGGSANSQSQDVYIDNININGPVETADSITLLVDNNDSSSSIDAYSSLSSTWLKNYISFAGNKIKPVYNYINGMLKISDANFSNNNQNKLLYFSKRTIPDRNIFPKWRSVSQSLPSPPSFIASQVDDNFHASAIFDCNKYFNSYFEGNKFRESGAGSDGFWPEAQTDTTNWPMDCFGHISQHNENLAGAINPTGLILRHWIDNNDQLQAQFRGRKWNTGYDETSEISGYQQLYNPSTTFYQDNFLVNENNQYIQSDDYLNSNYYNNTTDNGDTFYNLQANETLTNYGIKRDDDTVYNGFNDTYYLKTSMLGSINKYFAIESSVFSDVDSEFWKIPPDTVNPIKNIRYIDMKFKWELVGWSGPSIYADKVTLPVFDIQVGTPSSNEISGSDLKERQIKGQSIEFAENKSKTSQIGDIYRTNEPYSGAEKSMYSICNGQSNSECSGNLDRYDTRGRLISAEFNRGIRYDNLGEGYHGTNVKGANIQVIMDIEDKVEFSIDDDVQIDSTQETLLVKLAEKANHGGILPIEGSGDANCLNILAFLGTYGSNDGDMGPHSSIHNYVKYDASKSVKASNLEPSDETPGIHSSYYTRFVIEKFDVGFFTSQDVSPSEMLGESNVSINFSWEDGETEGIGWTDRTYEISMTSVNVFGEESGLSGSIKNLGQGDDGSSIILPGQSPSIRLRMKKSYLDDIFLSKTKIYMRDTESDTWFLQCYVDHEKSKFYSNTSFKSSDVSATNSQNEVEWYLDNSAFVNYNEINSYDGETMVKQEDAEGNSKLTCRYKTSVVANNRLYVGNIMQDGKIYGDRMLKSPFGKYNILPASNFIDVAINDGDEITALAYYKDKILQFKNRKVFIINISGDYEFLEDTLENIGVLQQSCVTKTPHGIAWVNKSGCYLYDGSQVVNLIDNKIPSVEADKGQFSYNYWLVGDTSLSAITSKIPAIGYSQDRDVIIVKWSSGDDSSQVGSAPDSIGYHFPTKSWSFNFNSIAGNSDVYGSASAANTRTGSISNMITDENGDIIYYRVSTDSSVDTSSNDGIKKWYDTPTKISHRLGAAGEKYFSFVTKDFTFGNIMARKKIYKVYITYKTTDGANSKVKVHASVNGAAPSTAFSDDTSKFAGTSTACYAETGNGLLDTGGDWKTAELKFSTPSNFNNIYSFQLQFVGLLIDVGFEINDVSVIYKTKRLK